MGDNGAFDKTKGILLDAVNGVLEVYFFSIGS